MGEAYRDVIESDAMKLASMMVSSIGSNARRIRPHFGRRPNAETELKLVLDSLAAARAMLLEDGMVVSRRPEGERKVLLSLGPQRSVECGRRC